MALVSALDLHRFPIAVRACRGLAHLSSIVLHPLGALVAAASMWSHKVKLGGHVNVQPPIAMMQLCTMLLQSVCKPPWSQTLRGEKLALVHRLLSADCWLILQTTGRSWFVRQCQCDTSEGHGGSLNQAGC